MAQCEAWMDRFQNTMAPRTIGIGITCILLLTHEIDGYVLP